MRPALAGVAVLGALLSASGCGTSGTFTRAQGGRFSRIPDVEPADVAGKQPVVVLEGEATYYSDSFAGRATTSGEPYDPANESL
jgi:rare lipoprotein A (peptidoglycan hydrolase)